MAWYRVAYRPSVSGDLLAVEKGMAQRLFDKTKWLASNVENLRHEPLAPHLPGIGQYAVGEWRTLYLFDREDLVSDVHLIGTRGELYRSRAAQKKS